MASSLDQYPQRDGMYTLLSDSVAVHNRYQNRLVMLDALSSEVWLRADGRTPLRVIARDLAGWLHQSTDSMLIAVPMILMVLCSEGLMFQLDYPTDPPYHLCLPQEDQDAEQTHRSLVASGWLKS